MTGKIAVLAGLPFMSVRHFSVDEIMDIFAVLPVIKVSLEGPFDNMLINYRVKEDCHRMRQIKNRIGKKNYRIWSNCFPLVALPDDFFPGAIYYNGVLFMTRANQQRPYRENCHKILTAFRKKSERSFLLLFHIWVEDDFDDRVYPTHSRKFKRAKIIRSE